jgi:stage II sporulation protein D
MSAAVTMWLSSCYPTASIQPREAPRLAGMPTVRVKLNPVPASTVSVAATSGHRIACDGKLVAQSAGRLLATDVTRSGGRWYIGRLSVPGQRVEISPGAGSFISANSVTYRGTLVLLAASDDTFSIINHVDLESYLAGVLPKELYSSWSPATYTALAVAARTFAIYHMRSSGVSREYDLGAGEASQVYGGFSAETAKSWDAVNQTHGKILMVPVDGKDQVILAQYSAACGGVVNGAYVIRRERMIQPFLGGQECNDCSSSPKYRWDPVRIPKTEIYSALAAAYPGPCVELGGAVTEIKVEDTTPWGRAIWLRVYGSSGKYVRVRAEDLRLALLRGSTAGKALYSMNCTIRDAGASIEFRDGQGHGHGVGLCQWGAEGKAKKGWDYMQILAFYYPGAKVATVY